MNGVTGTRRLARPVRLALAQRLGADIDGAWWPYTASVGHELPGLIEAMRGPLGEIVDCVMRTAQTESALWTSRMRDIAGTESAAAQALHDAGRSQPV